MNECLTEQVVISFIRFFLICIYIAGEFYWCANNYVLIFRTLPQKYVNILNNFSFSELH